jgi:hypothetical protein
VLRGKGGKGGALRSGLLCVPLMAFSFCFSCLPCWPWWGFCSLSAFWHGQALATAFLSLSLYVCVCGSIASGLMGQRRMLPLLPSRSGGASFCCAEALGREIWSFECLVAINYYYYYCYYHYHYFVGPSMAGPLVQICFSCFTRHCSCCYASSS